MISPAGAQQLRANSTPSPNNDNADALTPPTKWITGITISVLFVALIAAVAYIHSSKKEALRASAKRLFEYYDNPFAAALVTQLGLRLHTVGDTQSFSDISTTLLKHFAQHLNISEEKLTQNQYLLNTFAAATATVMRKDPLYFRLGHDGGADWALGLQLFTKQFRADQYEWLVNQVMAAPNIKLLPKPIALPAHNYTTNAMPGVPQQLKTLRTNHLPIHFLLGICMLTGKPIPTTLTNAFLKKLRNTHIIRGLTTNKTTRPNHVKQMALQFRNILLMNKEANTYQADQPLLLDHTNILSHFFNNQFTQQDLILMVNRWSQTLHESIQASFSKYNCATTQPNQQTLMKLIRGTLKHMGELDELPEQTQKMVVTRLQADLRRLTNANQPSVRSYTALMTPKSKSKNGSSTCSSEGSSSSSETKSPKS